MEHPETSPDPTDTAHDPLRFRIERGHPVAGPSGGWVYAWLSRGRIHYIGATWLHPAVRAEAHLRLPTDDVRSLALRERVAQGIEFEIVALPVPEGLDRAVLKLDLIAACHAAGWLHDGFIGAVPEQRQPQLPAEAAWLANALTGLGHGEVSDACDRVGA